MLSKEEDGCLLYQLCKGKQGGYTVIELYRSQAAFDHHNQTPHFIAAATKHGHMLSGKPEVRVLPVVGPTGLKTTAHRATIAVIAEVPVKDAAGFESATLPLMNEVQSKEV